MFIKRPKNTNFTYPFTKEKRGNTVITRGMNIHSAKLGISGQCDVVEFLFVLQWAENRELLNKRLAVKGFHTTVVESQPQRIIVKHFCRDNPYNIIDFFHFTLRV